MTLGITVFGIVQPGASGELPTDPRAILTPEARAAIPAPVLEKITDILASSIAQTFMWALIPAVLAVFFILLMGKECVQASSADNQRTRDAGRRQSTGRSGACRPSAANWRQRLRQEAWER